jgi:hypothetical protein
MAEPPVEGITIRNDGDRVIIEVDGARWEGTAREAERLLTRLHYVLGRARPGLGIGSMFLNGTLWGAKFIEPDSDDAIDEMRYVVDRLQAKLEEIAAGGESSGDPPISGD